TRVGQCWSNGAQARRAPTRDRELPRSAEPDGRPALRPRGRTHRTADPAHPCSAPSSKLSVDGRFTSTESRFALLLKTVLQQNRPEGVIIGAATKLVRWSPIMPSDSVVIPISAFAFRGGS